MPGRLVRRLHLDGIPVSQWVQALLVGAVVGALVANIIAVVLLLDNSNKARQQRATQLQQSRLLVECTTAPELRRPQPRDVDPAEPGLQVGPEDCYSRQQASTGALVGEPAGPLNTVTVLAAACGPGTPEATLACVERALRAQP